MTLMKNWFVPNDVMVKTGAVCDRAVNAVAAIIKPLAPMPVSSNQFLFIVFMRVFIQGCTLLCRAHAIRITLRCLRPILSRFPQKNDNRVKSSL